MTEIPEDIQDGIKKLSEATETPLKELIARLKEIMDTDENIQTMEKESFKIHYAWAVLYREHSMTGKAEMFLVRPICFPRARKITIKGEGTYVGDLSAIVQKLSKNEEGNLVKGDMRYASGTFWRDGAKNLDKLISGGVYKSSIIAKDNSWGLEISSDRATFAKTEEELQTFDEFYKENIETKDLVITIGEMDLNKSETPTDIRIIEATVIGATVGTSASGGDYGRYDVMDDSIAGSSFAIFVDPRDVQYEQGSILKFGGTIDIDAKTGDVRWRNHFILPTELAMKKTFEIKPVTAKAEEVDLSKEEVVLTDEPTEPVEEKHEEKAEEPKKKETEEVDFEV